MIYSILDIAYNIYVFISLHQTKKYDSIKWNPRKRKWKTMIYSGMRPIKKGEGTLTFHGQLFCHYLQLHQEQLIVSEIGKNENPLVSAF